MKRQKVLEYYFMFDMGNIYLTKWARVTIIIHVKILQHIMTRHLGLKPMVPMLSQFEGISRNLWLHIYCGLTPSKIEMCNTTWHLSHLKIDLCRGRYLQSGIDLKFTFTRQTYWQEVYDRLFQTFSFLDVYFCQDCKIKTLYLVIINFDQVYWQDWAINIVNWQF